MNMDKFLIFCFYKFNKFGNIQYFPIIWLYMYVLTAACNDILCIFIGLVFMTLSVYIA